MVLLVARQGVSTKFSFGKKIYTEQMQYLAVIIDVAVDNRRNTPHSLIYAQRGVQVFVKACRTTDDLMRRCTINGTHRQEERFSGAAIGQINSNHYGNTNADAEQCEHELPGMSPKIAKTGAIQDWRFQVLSCGSSRPSCNSSTRSQLVATIALWVATIIVPPTSCTS